VQPGGALKFLQRRLKRIVPLYWIMTTAFLAVLLAGRGAGRAGGRGPRRKAARAPGGASCAMYLVHPFVMRGFTVLWHKFHVGNELGGTIYVLAGLAVAQFCALGINMTLERKVSLLLRSRGLKNETV
jgi:peptidoglycan/LPS O-acetylase OafA/YrhL